MKFPDFRMKKFSDAQHNYINGVFAALLLIISQCITGQELKWPGITKETRPWTRMWWMGSIGTKQDITSAFTNYKDAGLGGLEITCIYGVKGRENEFVNYLSPGWMDKFTHILTEGERLELGIDLANASGWPFGGPWVNSEDASRNINVKTFMLNEGEKLNEKVEFIQQPLIRAAGIKPDMSTLSEPVSINKNLQLYALDQIRFEKALPLKSLIAYSSSGDIIDLTEKISDSGYLDWIAPTGEWRLYALFEGWHGKMSERAGPGGEGNVIDHFSQKATENFLSKFNESFKGYDTRYLRGYFNDSYEVDDASGQADWTDSLFTEFERRRGYDLKYHLPALFQMETPEKNERILSDYRQTISEMILENFTIKWTDWAHDAGKITRNQAHGSPGNILDLYAASDIPETEGYELSRLKFASSAANVTGKRLVSCEAATWLNEHFVSSLSDIKNAADLFFLSGINHLFYHGTCFTPEDDPWPGFLFYAATEFTPANSFWKDFHALNDYVTRVQSFMQNGKADNDVLLYFPIFDSYSVYGRGMLQHFDGLTPEMKKSRFGMAVEQLPGIGFSYDYISDLQISKIKFTDGRLRTEGNDYETIIIPGCKYIPSETFSKLIELSNEGATIVFYGDLPENVSGFTDFGARTLSFNEMKGSLHFYLAGEHAKIAVNGKGKLISGDNLGELLNVAGLKNERMSIDSITFIRRKTDNGLCYFIKNSSGNAFEGWLPLSTHASSAGIFNPLSGDYGKASIRTSGEGIEIYIQLRPTETMIIETYSGMIKGENYWFYTADSAPDPITGKWKLTFVEGGPNLPESRTLDSLVSWTQSGGDDVKNFSGSAIYSTSFSKPAGKADAWKLDLGNVSSSAEVYINCKKYATLIGPYFDVEIGDKDLKRENTLEIVVSNLMANRIAWMDRNGIEWKKFYNVNMAAKLKENTKNGIFDASHWLPMQSGLLGPVTLTPLSVLKQ